MLVPKFAEYAPDHSRTSGDVTRGKHCHLIKSVQMASNAITSDSDSDSDHSSSDSVGYLDSVTEVESEPASLSLQGILPYQYEPPARQSNNEAETCEREADSAAGETRVGNTEW